MSHYYESEIYSLDFNTIFLLQLVNKIGVYLLLNARNEVLYVGRSTNLNDRLNHWCKFSDTFPKFKYWLVNSEVDGYEKESELYHKFLPPHNDIPPNRPWNSLQNYPTPAYTRYRY